ncbi:MAG: MSMEG_0568 family radical SAM protein [Methanocellales archaeon]|nr:MSMEG_0568 family radical SAM protein [Methanocellales archaeon]
MEDQVINAPIWGDAKNSPFTLTYEDGLKIVWNDESVETEIPDKPRFYDLQTSDGTPMKFIALRHAADVLASTVYQKCIYWAVSKQCKFCAIQFSLESGDTILLKTGEQLGEVALAAVKYGDASHVTLTTGTPNERDYGTGVLSEACAGIKAASPLKVHVQLSPPEDFGYLDELANAGVDTIGLHMESADPEVLRNVCPAKAEIGFKRYYDAVEYSIGLFGENQVSSFLLAGLGEDPRAFTDACERLSSLGAVTYIVPFRPLPNTPLSESRMPSHEYLHNIYAKCGSIMNDYGVRPSKSKAGCVRCGACSLIQDYVRGEKN